MELETKATKSKAIDLLPMVLMGGLFVLVDLLGFWITGPFIAAGEVAYIGSGPGDFVNLLFFFSVLIVFTAVILLIAKWGKTRIIQAVFLGSTGLLGIYVFFPLLSYLVTWELALGFSALIMAVIVGLLVKFPEWYIVDIRIGRRGHHGGGCCCHVRHLVNNPHRGSLPHRHGSVRCNIGLQNQAHD